MEKSDKLKLSLDLKDDNWNVYESYLAAYCPNIPDPDNNGPRPGPGSEGIEIVELSKCVELPTVLTVDASWSTYSQI